jgi:hypothetical protein
MKRFVAGAPRIGLTTTALRLGGCGRVPEVPA